MLFEKKYYLLVFLVLLYFQNSFDVLYSEEPQIIFDINKSNTLNAFKIRNNNSEFLASNFGGISVVNKNF